MFLRIARPFIADTLGQVAGRFKPFSERRNTLVRVHDRSHQSTRVDLALHGDVGFGGRCYAELAGFGIGDFDKIARDVCLDVKVAFLINPVDLRQLGHGRAGDKVGQGHKPRLGAHAQRVQCGQHAILFWQAHTDVDLFIATFGRVAAKHDAAGDQLHHAANRGYIRAIPACILHIHADFPVNTGQGPTVFDQGQTRGLFEQRARISGSELQLFPVIARQAQVQRFCGPRPHRQVKDFGADAGDRIQFCLQRGDDHIAV